LPANLSVESEAFLPGWRVVKNPVALRWPGTSGCELELFLPGREIRATVLGRDRPEPAQGSEACSGEQEGQNLTL